MLLKYRKFLLVLLTCKLHFLYPAVIHYGFIPKDRYSSNLLSRNHSLFSVIRKVLEKDDQMHTGNILTKSQSKPHPGFTKSSSSHAALLIPEMMSKANDRHTSLTFAPLVTAKAFDVV